MTSTALKVWVLGFWNKFTNFIHRVCYSLVFTMFSTLGSGNVSMLTHIYPHKPPWKVKVATSNHENDGPFYFWPDVCSDDSQTKKENGYTFPYKKVPGYFETSTLVSWGTKVQR